jgi:transposase
MEITDEQWAVLEPLIPVPMQRADGKGRPRRDAREVLSGILWVLRTGAAWDDLPDRYPPHQTCHRRFQEWRKAGVMENLLRRLVEDLKERGDIDLTEAFIDGTFSSAKKGALAWAKLSEGKAPRSWPLQTALVFLSPYPLQVLRRMKSRLSKARSTQRSSTSRRSD